MLYILNHSWGVFNHPLITPFPHLKGFRECLRCNYIVDPNNSAGERPKSVQHAITKNRSKENANERMLLLIFSLVSPFPIHLSVYVSFNHLYGTKAWKPFTEILNVIFFFLKSHVQHGPPW
jgi:hypothetical protein